MKFFGLILAIAVTCAYAGRIKPVAFNLELIQFEQDTVTEDSSQSPVVIMETFIIEADSFHFRRWFFYVGYDSIGYLNADCCMPGMRVDNVMKTHGDTITCQGEKKGCLFIADKNGNFHKQFDARLVRYYTDSHLQEFWCDIISGKFYINKNYKRRNKHNFRF